MWKNCATLFIAVILSLLLAEYVIRKSGKYTVYSEVATGKYVTLFPSGRSSWYLTQPPNYYLTVCYPEFNYSYCTNKSGFVNQEFSKEKSPGITRILALGDSFTEGTGAPENAGWCRQLELRLNLPAFAYEVWNCGVSGSDPVYYWRLLRDSLLQYQPDIVLVNINRTDISEIAVRTGFQRFQNDGTVRYKPAPRLEFLYQYSHLARLFINELLGYDYLLRGKREEQQETLLSLSILQACADSITHACSEQARVVFVFHPVIEELQLDTLYCLPVLNYCKEKNYPVINLFDYYRANISPEHYAEYYWVIDGHHNAKGYALFAEGVAEKL